MLDGHNLDTCGLTVTVLEETHNQTYTVHLETYIVAVTVAGRNTHANKFLFNVSESWRAIYKLDNLIGS